MSSNRSGPFAPLKSNLITSKEKSQHMMYRTGYRFTQMPEMKSPHFDDKPYIFFEPRPSDVIDDTTLEGCLRHASKVEQLIDKNNLYLCEPCTIDRYGKSSSKKHRT